MTFNHIHLKTVHFLHLIFDILDIISVKRMNAKMKLN